MNKNIAKSYLVGVAALWGLTFPLMEISMREQDPLLFVAFRFTLAALPILPFFISTLTRETLSMGVVFGLLNCPVYIMQSIGMQYTDASRAAFLTGTSVLMIPFLAPLFRMGTPTRHEWISGFICLLGIYVLTGCELGCFGVGDLWILGCALFNALLITYIGRSLKSGVDPILLTNAQIVMTALFSSMIAYCLSDCDFSPYTEVNTWMVLGICSFLATNVALLWQSKYQKYVSLQSTVLIFSLEPLFATLFDNLFTWRGPSIYTMGGGMLIVCSILYLKLLKPAESNETTEEI
jgi:drug/metabolite transporter (DMT)-like permease